MLSVLETTWAALAEPNRRAALDLLRVRPCTVGEVAEALGVAQPTASKHLKVLREAGLVRVSAEAQRRIYRLDPEPLVGLDDWLAPYRALWNDRLDALGRHLDAKYPDTQAEAEGEAGGESGGWHGQGRGAPDSAAVLIPQPGEGKVGT
jgi:DNA-binding transcriptional ArsR family regulator